MGELRRRPLDDVGDPTFHHLRLRDASFAWVDVESGHAHHAGIRNVRLRGVQLENVEIDGELQNVVVNGIDVAPLVEAEMARRDPDYALMKPTDAAGFRRAWDVLEARWAATVERARALPGDLAHERVDDEWSFIETLRHLCYATDSWVNRVYLGDPEPWSPLDLPFDTLLDLEWPHDTDVRPSLDEVLALRSDRQATVRRVLAELTDADLAGRTTPVDGPSWPPADAYDVLDVFSIVVNEEYHHRRFAERDLTVLESRG